MVADNLESVSKILLKRYNIAVEAHKIRRKIEEDQVKIDGIVSLQEEQGKSKEDIDKATQGERERIEKKQKGTGKTRKRSSNSGRRSSKNVRSV